MKSKKITFNHDGISHNVEVEVMDTILKKARGLMFKKKSPPLLFVFNKEKSLNIHSFFCKPFTAIWLDKNFNATKFVKAVPNKINYSGKGMYLLEVPKE
jgi:uncharacterized membrane protein (UPF0127 family)